MVTLRSVDRAPDGGLFAVGTHGAHDCARTGFCDAYFLTRLRSDGRRDRSFGLSSSRRVEGLPPRPRDSWPAPLPDAATVLLPYGLESADSSHAGISVSVRAQGQVARARVSVTTTLRGWTRSESTGREVACGLLVAVMPTWLECRDRMASGGKDDPGDLNRW